ncbi:C6 transcription factor [Purpureocillium lavendulum]|uniref:C6 transcription factor n=1 Tax=Purpureocillium lavendulum TaxID=1247861 RepID=A0AB34FFH7_9HYPO|nr:C6 transcription factor [Purpureocillium lavendulum]
MDRPSRGESPDRGWLSAPIAFTIAPPSRAQFESRVEPQGDRTGCFTCRRRKKKCNEEKPLCSGCKRNKLDCRWPTEAASSSVSASVSASSLGSSQARSKSMSDASPPNSISISAAQRMERHAIIAASMSPEEPRRPQERKLSRHEHQSPRLQRIEPAPEPASSAHLETHSPRDFFHVPSDPGPDMELDDGDVEDVSHDVDRRSSSTSSNSTASLESLPLQSAFLDDTVNDLALISSGLLFDDSSGLHDGITMPMSLLPTHGHSSYELLSYYLSRTANSMGNGSTDVNPFVAKLVPLAFSNPLVLQLILAQSAAHRQASKEPDSSNEIAQRYYTDSLRMFRNVVGEYVARGDIHGTIFDHLTASKSLLTALLGKTKAYLNDDLPDFLVEYYMHTAASSMISTDFRQSNHSLLSPHIEDTARTLVNRKYIGQLCGCWLELLLLIPQVFQLGKSIMGDLDGDGEQQPPSTDDIISFGFLQSQILAFFPSPIASPYSQLAGLVWKQGVLLYLWSILGTPQMSPAGSAHKDLMDSAIAEAIAALSQFPASVRVNTSLCWPLAVIGCCTADPGVQEILRARLQTMIDTIGLGNMRETLVLLERVWRQPVEETSPWSLHKAMQDHQIWISFA